MSDVFKVEGKVSLDTDQFYSQVDSVIDKGKDLSDTIDKQSSGMKSALENAFSFSLGNTMSDIGQKAAQMAMDFVKDSISVASNIQEVQNVVDVTFGEAAAQLDSWANSAREQFGLTELQAKQYASTMGSMLKSMGITENKVYDMSTAMAGLSADMASFYNIDFDEAFSKIRSGISGETEPLKQLGINMSVANLEAFALANGVTKAYESMTQAEQATLRYNYLLQTTADAQGDFARTSDSYANSLRLLETNVDSLKAHLGEMLLPVVNDFVNVVNSLFEDNRTLGQKMADADASFEQSAASIAMNDARARSFINTLEELSGKENLTTEETAQWKAAVNGLTEIYPDLSEMIGTNTGKLNSSVEAIRSETSALKENAIEKAKAAALQEKLDAWADTAVKAGEKKVELGEQWAVWQEYERQRAELFDQIIGMTNLDRENMQPFFDNYDMLDSSIIGTDAAVLSLADSYNTLTRQSSDANQATNALTRESNALQEQLASQESELNSETEMLERAAIAGNSAGEGAKNAGNGMEEMTSSADSLTDSLKELKTEGANVKKLLQDIEKYKLNNFNQIRSQIEKTYDTFEKADRVRKTSAKKMLGNLDSQIEQADRFQEAYKTLQEMGAGDTLMSQFDYSPESIAQMEALIKSGSDGIESATEKIEELKTKQGEIAQSMSDTSLAVDTTFQEMNDTATQKAESLKQLAQGIVENVSGMAASVLEESGLSEEALSNLQAAGEALSAMEWEPTVDVEDNATSIIEAIDAALANLDGKTATVHISTSQTGGAGDGSSGEVYYSRATGLDYVPYDDYAAKLHKGESVLTRAEADNWRKGGREKKEEQPITINLTMNGSGGKPYEIANEVRNALENLRWFG